MAFSATWRMYRRMQDSTLAAAVLVYAAAAINAWRWLPGGRDLKLEVTLLFPGLFFALSFLAILLIPVLRAALWRHLWVQAV
jgi:hypothetical protein